MSDQGQRARAFDLLRQSQEAGEAMFQHLEDCCLQDPKAQDYIRFLLSSLMGLGSLVLDLAEEVEELKQRG